MRLLRILSILNSDKHDRKSLILEYLQEGTYGYAYDYMVQLR